jgi:hypothetical protein
MFGGALTLTNEAHLKEELVGFFMLFTFLTIIITEVLLVRQLSRLTQTREPNVIEVTPPFPAIAQDFGVPPRSLAEPLQSVTENTTRTLAYTRTEPHR